jgi:hypothetical protein
MADRWYYAHEGDKKGPFTSQELRSLADAGEIVPTDTVWKEGVEQGVAANRVKNLFPPPPNADALAPAVPSTKVDQDPAQTAPAPAPEPPAATAPEESPEEVTSDPVEEPGPAEFVEEERVEDQVPLRAPPSTPGGGRRPEPVRKARAVSGKGTTVVGQDGTYARVRKKCDKCGQEDSSVATVRIKSGNNKLFFFCRKCKKQREVTFQGIIT